VVGHLRGRLHAGAEVTRRRLPATPAAESGRVAPPHTDSPGRPLRCVRCVRCATLQFVRCARSHRLAAAIRARMSRLRSASENSPGRGRYLSLYTAVVGCRWLPLLRDLHGSLFKGKIHRVGPNVGQLQASNRDFQSNCWADLRIWGQPCDFQVLAVIAVIGGQNDRAALPGENSPSSAVITWPRSTQKPLIIFLHGESLLRYNETWRRLDGLTTRG
jgi:hypothetical protein